MIKRILDCSLALLGFILFSPLFIGLSVAIACNMGFPVFFKQKRAGLNGKPFFILKFRSMTNDKNENGDLKPDLERLTTVGKFLRKYSLDEIPQVFNVIKGDMSLVGPRPLLVEYLPYYSERHYRRHNVLPGITGWAQVNGRQSLKWSRKFDLDVFYVENQSFWFDLKILFLTASKVIKSDGVKSGVSEEEDDLGIWAASRKDRKRLGQNGNQ